VNGIVKCPNWTGWTKDNTSLFFPLPTANEITDPFHLQQQPSNLLLAETMPFSTRQRK